MKCLLVINRLAGNSCKVDVNIIKARYAAAGDDVSVFYIDDDSVRWDAAGYDKVVVCGGDGTLYNALNACDKAGVKEVVYVACGTLNETFNQEHTGLDFALGKLDDKSFSYVAAVGTFTEIGYATDTKKKQRLKVLAYLSEVLRYYKVHRIPAMVEWDGGKLAGDFTLLMVLHSERCFGLRFNRLHRKHPEKLFLLTIKSNGKDNLWNRIRLFFPLFRVFFLGVRKPIQGKNVTMVPFSEATVKFRGNVAMCVDGERVAVDGDKAVKISTAKPTFQLWLDRY